MNCRGCIFLIVLGFVLTGWSQTTKPKTRQEAEYYVLAYAQHYRVPVPLVRAVIERESNWRPCAISRKGAVGLMQLMPMTAQRLRVRDRCSIDQNVSGGVRYLAWLIQKFHGDLRLVSAAYYAGENRVSRRGLAYRNPDVVGYVSRKRTQKFPKPFRKEIYDENLPKFVSSYNAAGMFHAGGSAGRSRSRQDSQPQSRYTERYDAPIATWICHISSPTGACQFRSPRRSSLIQG
jgi:hypothetical protein